MFHLVSGLFRAGTGRLSRALKSPGPPHPPRAVRKGMMGKVCLPVGLLTRCFIYIQLQSVTIKTKQWSEQPLVLGSLGSGFGGVPIAGSLAVRRPRTFC